MWWVVPILDNTDVEHLHRHGKFYQTALLSGDGAWFVGHDLFLSRSQSLWICRNCRKCVEFVEICRQLIRYRSFLSGREVTPEVKRVLVAVRMRQTPPFPSHSSTHFPQWRWRDREKEMSPSRIILWASCAVLTDAFTDEVNKTLAPKLPGIQLTRTHT